MKRAEATEARALLAKAVHLERSGAAREALELFLATWAAVRAPAIAERLEALSKTLEPTLPVVDSTGRGGFKAAVAKRIAASSIFDVGPIVTGLSVRQRALGAVFIAEQLVALLERHPHDPRLSHLTWLTCRNLRISHPTAAGRSLFVRLSTRAVALRDPRFVTGLSDELRAGPGFFPTRNEDGRRDVAALEALVERLDAEPDVTTPAWVTRELASHARTNVSLDKLLEAVHAAPEDLERRLVYADALQEAGDPRGEFITLQCTRTNGKVSSKEKALLRNHGAVWLGKHEKAFERAGLEFKRGFLATARLKWIHALVGPEWATIEALEVVDSYGGEADAAAVCQFLKRPDLRVLRALWVSGDCLLPLARALPNIVCLGLTRDVSERVLRRFPELRRFEAYTLEPSETTALLKHCPKLEVVKLGAAEAVPLLVGRVSQVELSSRQGLAAPTDPLVFTFRGKKLERLEVGVTGRQPSPHSQGWAEQWVAHLPRGFISAVTLAPAVDQPWLRAALRRCVSRTVTWSRGEVAIPSWRDLFAEPH